MDASISPSTLLDAVNVLLATLGEAPVTSIETTQNALVATAVGILANTSRRVQSEGWSFNKELLLQITPDTSGNINLPTNTLRVDPSGENAMDDYVQRGQRLYDRVKHTFVFAKPVYVDLIVALTFDELPQAAKDYITVRSARVFQAQQLGSTTLYQFTAEDEQAARILLRQYDDDTEDANIFGFSGRFDPSVVTDRFTRSRN